MTKAKLLWFNVMFMLATAADAVFGLRCDRCAQRVYSRDRLIHDMGCD